LQMSLFVTRFPILKGQKLVTNAT